MRIIHSLDDWISEFSLQYFEGGNNNPTLLPPIPKSIEVHPHQFKPRVMLENDPNLQSLLIADEVGLGKTYSTCHVIHNMISQGLATRVLILCPARLVKEKWMPTLNQFRTRPSQSYSGRGLKRWLEGEYNSTVMVSSYEKASEQGVSIDEFEQAFVENNFQDIDLLVIDEIHNLVQDAKLRIRLAKIVLSLSKIRIGLTATPIWNGIQDFSKLIQLIEPQGQYSKDLEKEFKIQGLIFRAYYTLLNDNHDKDELNHILSEIKSHFPNKFDVGISRNLNKEKMFEIREKVCQLSPFSSWMTRTTAKEVLSSKERVINSPILIDLDDKPRGKRYDPDLDKIVEYDSEKVIFDKIDDLLQHSSHKLQHCSLPSAFSSHMEQVIKTMDKTSDLSSEIKDELTKLSSELSEESGSKLKALISRVEELAVSDFCSGIVIFTKWIPTYLKVEQELKKRLAKAENIRLFFGDPRIDNEELVSVKNAFQKHDEETIPVILVTEKFNEGLDLFRANCMIHIDIPNNPLKLEQRIGRIDRMGQVAEKIYIDYILLNQSKEHERISSLKEKLSQFSEYFGAANPILPDDIGWRGNVSDEDLSTIRTLDLESMSNLSLPNEQLSSLSKEMAERMYSPLRSTYSSIIIQIFSSIFDDYKSVSEKCISFDITGNNVPNNVQNFTDRNSEIDEIMVAQINREKRFELWLDEFGLPEVQEIRRQSIRKALENSPNLEPIIINSSCSKDDTYILQFTCSVGQRVYTQTVGYQKINNNWTKLASGKWLGILGDIDCDKDIYQPIDSSEFEGLKSNFTEEKDIFANNFLTREQNYLSYRIYKLEQYLEVIEPDKIDKINKIENLLENLKNEFSNLSISQTSIKFYAIIRGD